MFNEEDLIPISALQHWLYCPRQWALIHLEQAWTENRFTAEGRVFHENAHEGADETKGQVRITRGMSVSSTHLGMAGQCDVVEFHTNQKILPIEYKRGKPKQHHADEAQLCAQALCLEEMTGIHIPFGALYYGEKKRRTDISFDEHLRSLVRTTLSDIRACFASKQTPHAEYIPKLCDACSLIDECQPKAMRFKKGAAAWFAANIKTEGETPFI